MNYEEMGDGCVYSTSLFLRFFYVLFCLLCSEVLFCFHDVLSAVSFLLCSVVAVQFCLFRCFSTVIFFSWLFLASGLFLLFLSLLFFVFICSPVVD